MKLIWVHKINYVLGSFKIERNISQVTPGELAQRLQPTAKSKMAVRGPQNGRRGLGSGLPLGFWALPSTFAK